jgi:thiamine-phosphate pyrophosphorylase
MSSARSHRRIVDANLNRAAEGLRVAEDVARFHWSLGALARELKDLRHDLFSVARTLEPSAAALAAARDAVGDVGAPAQRTAGERAAADDETAKEPAGASDGPDLLLPEIAARNLERGREALRVLEELARAPAPAAARGFEALRYRLYTIEKRLLLLTRRGERHERLAGARLLLLVTSALCRRPWLEVVESAIAGGVDIVELREKALGDRELLARASSLRELTLRHGVLFVVNDRPDLARLAHADGIHLGQDDLGVAAARAITGGGVLAGVSAHSLEQLRAAEDAGADYAGVGPCFPTATKDAGPPLDLDVRRAMLAEASIPAFAIGGVTPATIGGLVESGARRAAAASAILGAADPRGAAAAIRGALEAAGSAVP